MLGIQKYTFNPFTKKGTKFPPPKHVRECWKSDPKCRAVSDTKCEP